jgi:hypothetical protein
MTLQVVKSSTNWSPGDLQVLQRMKKNYAEMDERSGRPWKLGDDLLLVDPPGADGVRTGRLQRIEDAARYIGCSGRRLYRYGTTAAAWPATRRRVGVSYAVFEELNAYENRFDILKKLVEEYGAENIQQDDVRRYVGTRAATPKGSTERLQAFYDILEKFPTSLKAKDRLLARQIINRLYVLLGEAEEEAV